MTSAKEVMGMDIVVERHHRDTKILFGSTEDRSWSGCFRNDDISVMRGQTSMTVEMKRFGFRARLPRSFGSDEEWEDPEWVVETVWVALKGYLDPNLFAGIMNDIVKTAYENGKKDGVDETQKTLREALGIKALSYAPSREYSGGEVE